MNRKSLIGVIAIVLLVGIFSSWYLFIQRPTSLQNSSVQPVELSGAFAGSDVLSQSADGLSLSRVVRGYVDSWTEPKDSQIFITTLVNWPKEEPTSRLVFSVLPQTEYLCWPSTFTTGDGNQAQIKDTVYLLDNNTKLYLPNQTRLSYEEAMAQFTQGSSVIIALQEPYSMNKDNVAFQVAMVGCQ